MSGRRRKLARILDAAERGEAVPMQAGYWLAHEYRRAMANDLPALPELRRIYLGHEPRGVPDTETAVDEALGWGSYT